MFIKIDPQAPAADVIDHPAVSADVGAMVATWADCNPGKTQRDLHAAILCDGPWKTTNREEIQAVEGGFSV